MRLWQFIFLFVISIPSIAQEELEEFFIPPDNSVFSSKYELGNNRYAEVKRPHYILKIVPTSLFRNIYSLEFEKPFAERFGLGLIAGYCTGIAKIQTSTVQSYAPGDSRDISPEYLLSQSKNNGGGLVYGIYLRIYRDLWYTDTKSYFEFYYRHWSFGYNYYYAPTRDYGSINPGRFQNDFFGALYGLYFNFGKDSKIVLDAKVGLGINTFIYDSFARDEDFDIKEIFPSGKQKITTGMFYSSIAFGFAKFKKD